LNFFSACQKSENLAGKEKPPKTGRKSLLHSKAFLPDRKFLMLMPRKILEMVAKSKQVFR